jgi:hypothetical protein
LFLAIQLLNWKDVNALLHDDFYHILISFGLLWRHFAAVLISCFFAVILCLQQLKPAQVEQVLGGERKSGTAN